jgi:long-chain acyl-CoA synthetase
VDDADRDHDVEEAGRAEVAMARISAGNACNASITRMTASSAAPPRYRRDANGQTGAVDRLRTLAAAPTGLAAAATGCYYRGRMTTLAPPPIVARGRRWSRDALTGAACRYADALGQPFLASPDPVAISMDNDAASVALLFALSCGAAPIVLLPPDLAQWRGALGLPRATRLVATAGQRTDVWSDALGPAVILPVPADDEKAATGEMSFMRAPGLVLFTSGSTGAPRPVYRGMAAVVRVARALVAAVGLGGARGIIGVLPLARAYGLNHGLMAAAVTGAPLALLDRFDHGALLRLFATGAYDYWSGTPMMADVLGRCAITGEPIAPRLSVIGGRLSPEVARRFQERFGVPLRQIYGTTETGSIAVDGGPVDSVRSESAGRLLPGVEVRIGDDPRAPLPPGAVGRIWVSAPSFLMDGYGVPPDLDPPDTADGWWGTRDVGALEGEDRLVLAGRLDDCIRTPAGHLVSASSIGGALDGDTDVVEAAVVPLTGREAGAFGVLAECDPTVTEGDIRGRLAHRLPGWSQPRVVATTGALPRLGNGRVDRRECIAILEARAAGAPARE